jgi:hypothetical protein
MEAARTESTSRTTKNRARLPCLEEYMEWAKKLKNYGIGERGGKDKSCSIVEDGPNAYVFAAWAT